MIGYVLIYVVSVFISSLSQILLKKSAVNGYDKMWKEYINPYVISGYAILLIASLLTVIAYRKVPLSKGPMIESLGYIFVSVFEYIFFKERIGRKKAIGISLIVLGVTVSCIS